MVESFSNKLGEGTFDRPGEEQNRDANAAFKPLLREGVPCEYHQGHPICPVFYFNPARQRELLRELETGTYNSATHSFTCGFLRDVPHKKRVEPDGDPTST